VPEFVVSIGLSIEGVAVLGVLYNPITEETFSGFRGEGAWFEWCAYGCLTDGGAGRQHILRQAAQSREGAAERA